MTVRDLLPLLPDPAELRARCRGIALLDSILDPHAPVHAFVRDWREGVDLATMDNGSGDQYAIVFDPAGVFLYGFDHESDASPWRDEDHEHWPGLLDGLPAPLAHYAQTPEFQFEGFFDATVCAWRESGDAEWRCGPVEFGAEETDGAEGLFGLLVDAGPGAYAGFAEDYFERSVDRGAVAAVLAGDPLTRRTVESLCVGADFGAVAARARAMGFGEPAGSRK
ncbi:hypothetical protein [Kitasatospora purpeofusca]|uniref:hypothetical protein n=1 Tax=Kitasatospora purpeofusca TaxID=67352 RepID=UPI00225BB60B|nr:hypothetical protein [Kitasatospora purpeofusca]MCX4759060.1 hypothetical protein [Kitasatospora purpeofusca]WSR30524.1 hypothetical protein OG715_05860 [Kitasatospora purpeofusca]